VLARAHAIADDAGETYLKGELRDAIRQVDPTIDPEDAHWKRVISRGEKDELSIKLRELNEEMTRRIKQLVEDQERWKKLVVDSKKLLELERKLREIENRGRRRRR
jgi:hypothetical protein